MNPRSNRGAVGARLGTMEDKPKETLWGRWTRNGYPGYCVYQEFLEAEQKEIDAKDVEIQKLKDGLKVSRDVTSSLVQELHRRAGWKESAKQINEDLRGQVKDLEERLEIQKEIQDTLRGEIYQKDSTIQSQFTGSRKMAEQFRDLEKELECTRRELAGAQNALDVVSRTAEFRLGRLQAILSVVRDQSMSCVDRIMVIKDGAEDYTQ